MIVHQAMAITIENICHMICVTNSILCLPRRIILSGCLAMLATPALAERHALLIGVSDYTDSRVPDLEGPYFDVTALENILQLHWQFDTENITSLLNESATEVNVLNALDALTDTTQPGDDILIYFSGHGTSASDPLLGSRLHLPDGSGAIVTSEFDPDKLNLSNLVEPTIDGLLIGRYELRPRLQLLDQERNILVVFDACFSGNTARGDQSRYVPRNKRQLSLLKWLSSSRDKKNSDKNGDTNTAAETGANTDANTERFSYTNIVYFGAAAEDQLAVDFSQAELDAGLVTSFDGNPHGGLTDSLLRVLADPGSDHEALSYGRLFNLLVNQFNTHCKTCGHNPVSLPIINNDEHHLLDRVFLSSTNTNKKYHRPSTPASTYTQLVVEAGDNTGAARQLAANTQQSAQANRSPDVIFQRQQEDLIVTSGDGQLITTFPVNTASIELDTWLVARQWLKQRKAKDLQQESANLRVEFRHPVFGATVKGGENVYFNLQTNTNASLCLLLLNANGELSVIYPASAEEVLRVLPAGARIRIPDIEATPIVVTPPWGTDEALFYALPPAHPILDELKTLSESGQIALDNSRFAAFESLLDSGTISYSAASIRFVSEL